MRRAALVPLARVPPDQPRDPQAALARSRGDLAPVGRCGQLLVYGVHDVAAARGRAAKVRITDHAITEVGDGKNL
eukprot:897535-Prymnesium_polylepis.1